jgi:hypothetical protein
MQIIAVKYLKDYKLKLVFSDQKKKQPILKISLIKQKTQ